MEAAFFDLDKTVIAKASMVAFSRPFYAAGFLSRRLVLRAAYGQLVYSFFGADEAKLRKVRETALRLTRGWDQAKVQAVVRETLEEVIEPIVFDEAIELLAEHRAAGRKLFLVSASPTEIVTPLGEYLGVDQSIATRALLDDHGRYTGEVEFYSYGPYKAEAITRLAAAQDIDLEQSWAYSDSATDLPMLEVVGHPVAVNPDRELARVAKEREWEIRHFIRRVRLRDRVPRPPGGRRTVRGIGLASIAAAAGMVAWRRLRPGSVS